MKKKIWISIGITSLILIMVGVSVYRTVLAKPPSVKVTEVKTEEVSSILMIPGTLELEEEQAIYDSMETGKIEEVLVEEGQEVKAGDVLAKADDTELNLETEQNKLSVESGYLRINQLDKQKERLNERKKELTEQVGKKEAEKQLASEFDQIDIEKRLANIELKQTLLQKDVLEKRLKDLEITSSINGTVLSISDASTESMTDVQEPRILIGSLNKVNATGMLSEYDALKVKIGQKVSLKSDVLPDQKWEGKIVKIGHLPNNNGLANQLENQAVQYPLTVSIQDKNIPLKPGFQLIMEIETEKKKGLVLPVEAIQYEEDKTYVYRVEGNKVGRKEVEIGISSGNRVEVLEGIEAGDKVILNPSDQIKDGMEVTTK